MIIIVYQYSTVHTTHTYSLPLLLCGSITGRSRCYPIILYCHLAVRSSCLFALYLTHWLFSLVRERDFFSKMFSYRLFFILDVVAFHSSFLFLVTAFWFISVHPLTPPDTRWLGSAVMTAWRSFGSFFRKIEKIECPLQQKRMWGGLCVHEKAKHYGSLTSPSFASIALHSIKK